MPIYSREEFLAEERPDWVEVTDWTFHYIERIKKGAGRAGAENAYWGTSSDNPRPTEITVMPRDKRDRIVVTDGEVIIEAEGARFHMSRRDYFDVPPSGLKVSSTGYTSAELVHISGKWDQIIRTEICAFGPKVPCDYHYHDGEEYWITTRGHYTLQYDDTDYPMVPNMLFAARYGHEHGIESLTEDMRAVVLGTGLHGENRDGHLVREKHGAPERVGDQP
jgi:mannose-6-phosphate isomerase-like protein (cupin superfamily)